MPLRSAMMTAVLTVAAVAGGIFIYHADTRSDDAGVTLAALLVFSFLLGLLGPRRAWLWALLVGVWMPLLNWILPPDPGLPRTVPSYLLLTVVIMGACFAGAYAGALLGKAARRALGFHRS